MAESLIDRAWRATTPDEIELDLADLWREVGRQGPVARAVMSNLVVVRQRPSTHDADSVNADQVAKQLPLDQVVAQHPSRVIVIQHDQHSLNCLTISDSKLGSSKVNCWAVENSIN